MSHLHTSLDSSLKDLRHLVLDCISKCSFSSATFYADKLVSLSNLEDISDIYLLSTCFFHAKQYKRLLSFLQPYSDSPKISIEMDISIKCLLIRSYFELGEFEAALLVGGRNADLLLHLQKAARSVPNVAHSISTASLLACLKAQCYEMLANLPLAAEWYFHALKFDAKNIEAFDKLIHHRLLMHFQEKELLASLLLPASMAWLKEYQVMNVEMYHCGDGSEMDSKVESRFDKKSNDSTRVSSLFSSKNKTLTSMLSENCDILAVQAGMHYYRHEFTKAYTISKSIMERDSFCTSVLPIYIGCLYELGMKSELYYTSHELVSSFSVDGKGTKAEAIGWYAVGCYYLLCSKMEQAKAFFHKCTECDVSFSCFAGLALGHVWALQEESDSAITAYRSAARWLQGGHMGLLYMGMEYIRTDNFLLGMQHLHKAAEMCPTDPLVHHELGVAAYKSKEYPHAITCFCKALSIVSWESTLVNLANCHRKLGDLDTAQEYYQRALEMNPLHVETLKLFGFTKQLRGEIDSAIDLFHKVLSLCPSDKIAQDLLERAFSELNV